MEMRIDGQNGKRSQTTNLKQHKKTHKKLEVGQTLTQPTGDPKLREKFETPTFSNQLQQLLFKLQHLMQLLN